MNMHRMVDTWVALKLDGPRTHRRNRRELGRALDAFVRDIAATNNMREAWRAIKAFVRDTTATTGGRGD